MLLKTVLFSDHLVKHIDVNKINLYLFDHTP